MGKTKQTAKSLIWPFVLVKYRYLGGFYMAGVEKLAKIR